MPTRKDALLAAAGHHRRNRAPPLPFRSMWKGSPSRSTLFLIVAVLAFAGVLWWAID
jgi:hypothetical protein